MDLAKNVAHTLLNMQDGALVTFQCKEHLLMANSGTHLTRRTGNSVIHTESTSIVFGGTISRTEQKSSEVWWIARNRLDWHMQLTFGNLPPPMNDHSAAFDHVANRQGFLYRFS